jgi:pilus assembly protein CpaB
MQRRNIIIAALAGFIGLIAVFLGNAYFSGLERKQAQVAKAENLARIVVASQDIPFAGPLSSQNLKLVNWPSDSVPAGAYTSFDAVGRGNRVAIRPMVAGEPVLPAKVSGENGRATIAAALPAGKMAYAIPINDVSGVGGFVRPGDIVDVLLTRPIPGDGATANDKMTDIVTEATPVLGVDQVASQDDTKPAVAKTVTLEVDSMQAQKLALSIQLGALSLALRNVADQEHAPRQTITPRALSAANIVIPRRAMSTPAPFAPAMPMRRPAGPADRPAGHAGPTMAVARGTTFTSYEVQRGY